MAKRVTPIKPRTEATVHLYIAGIGLALKITGKTRKDHRWYDDQLSLTLGSISRVSIARYSGVENIAVFPRAKRIHELLETRYSFGDYQWIHFKFEAVVDIDFTEPVLTWDIVDYKDLPQIIDIPKPTCTGFYWRTWNDQSIIRGSFECKESVIAADAISRRPKMPSQLDKLLNAHV